MGAGVAGLASLVVAAIVGSLVYGAGILLGASGWSATLVWVALVAAYLASRTFLRAVWSRYGARL